MDKIQWDLAGFTDEESRLTAYVQGYSAIWIPPEVQLAKMDGNSDDDPMDCIVYPLPEEWEEELIPLPGELSISSPSGKTYSLLRSLKSIGWKVREDADGVLNDFVKLAEASNEEILNFARKWGPLWLCMKHEECLWSPFSARTLRDGEKDCCLWFPMEPASVYRRCGRQVKTMLDAASFLMANKPVPSWLWRAIGGSGKESESSIPYQRLSLAFQVTKLLKQSQIRFSFWWDEAAARPSLEIAVGWGCLPKVCIELAQCLSGAKQLCVCDRCGKAYVRYDRKPQAGRNNYCPECRTKNAKQKVYARKKRTGSLNAEQVPETFSKNPNV